MVVQHRQLVTYPTPLVSDWSLGLDIRSRYGDLIRNITPWGDSCFQHWYLSKVSTLGKTCYGREIHNRTDEILERTYCKLSDLKIDT